MSSIDSVRMSPETTNYQWQFQRNRALSAMFYLAVSDGPRATAFLKGGGTPKDILPKPTASSGQHFWRAAAC
jgi:hypothetical protein